VTAAFTHAMRRLLERFGEGATLPDEHAGLSRLARALDDDAPAADLARQMSSLSYEGYLRVTVVLLAGVMLERPRADVGLLLAGELVDALDPELGIQVAEATLTLPEVERDKVARGGPWSAAHALLGEALEGRGDPGAALRHHEAVLAVDVDSGPALRGWSRCVRELERRGLPVHHHSRGLALLDGLEDLELADGPGVERYEIGRPLGRGRHAVVYEAFDRRVGRSVAIKRLLVEGTRRERTGGRVLHARFFAEARTLARVRSPYVVALLDVQPRHHFVALELCRGGNLRLAVRRGLIGREDVPRIGAQLRAAVDAVHAAGAVHRDVKPANILVREARPGAPIALADFGLAVPDAPEGQGPNAGTLRYLAPEIRRGGAASPASDRFGVGVVLLELALAPGPLPPELDRVSGDFDAAALVPDSVPEPWGDTIRSLLAPVPEARRW
jgi:tRNA A-37 threonylcarbamoyl transferase component Bud32